MASESRPPTPPRGSRDAGHVVGGTPLLRAFLVIIALALVAVISGGVWMVLRDSSGDALPTPTSVQQTTVALADQTPSPPDGGPEPTSTTPIGTPVPRSGSLASLLTLAPDHLDDDSVPLPVVASYADLAAWTTLHGMKMPNGIDDPALPAWMTSLDALALPTSLGTRGVEPIWQECYGFNLTDVHQVLSVGAAPNSVTIMTGEFDRHTLEDAWVRSGYQAVKIEGMTIWSLFPNDTIDLSARASRPSLGSLNNIVLLDDGTLVAAAKLSRLQGVLKVLHGNAGSLAQNDQVRDLIAPLGAGQGLISAEIARGDLVETPPMVAPADGTPVASIDTVATPVSSPVMPEVRLVLIGIRISPNPAGSSASPTAHEDSSPVALGTAVSNADEPIDMVTILTLADDDDAATARAVMTQRLGTGRSSVTGEPYARRYRDPHVQVAISPERAHAVVMSAGLTQGPADWRQIVETRDLGYAFWEPEP